jgi:prepilin-type N-terminal cleavage/methylation domain-containing protein
MNLDLESHKCNTYSRCAKNRGFTLFELAIVVAIVGVLGAALMTRIIFYQEQAELAGVEQLVGTMRSALNLKVARFYIDGNAKNLRSLADENPMDWLAEHPKNYLGEFYLPDGKDLAAGNWYYDRSSKCLVYLLNKASNVRDSGANALKFRVKVLISPSNVTKMHSSPDILEGVILEQVDG